MAYTHKWSQLTEYYKGIFHKPDLKTLRIVLACCCAHYLVNEDPVWLFVVGPSSAGKSSQILEPLSALDLVIAMDNVNTRSFMNAYEEKDIRGGKGKKKQPEIVEDNKAPNNGVLFRLKGRDPKLHGILTFSDFSTFTSLRQDERAMIQAQFRKIYDGKMSMVYGNNMQLDWEGKVTMIVAGTPEVERLTGNMSDVGDRFIKVRMGYPRSLKDRLELHKRVIGNMGNIKMIREKQHGLIKELIEGEDMIRSAKGLANENVNFAYLVELCLALRRTVGRDKIGKIVGIGKTENAGRITSAAVQIARGSAMLDRRKSITHTDMSLAIKVIIDNIPEERWFIVRDIYAAGKNGVATDYGLIQKYMGEIPPQGMSNCIDELEAMGIISVTRRRPSKNGKIYKLIKLMPEIRMMLDKGFKTDKLKSVYVKDVDAHGISNRPK